jgi:hypothetical protein
MANEQNKNTKSLTRSESMRRAWARRKSQVVTEVGWFQKPVCHQASRQRKSQP